MWRTRATLASVFLLVVCASARPALGAAPENTAAPLMVGGSTIHVSLADSEFAQGGAPIRRWIERDAGIVSTYYGTFPVRELWIKIEPTDGARAGGGTTYGEPRPFIRMRLGREVTDQALLSDWVLVHEMTHLALPEVGPEHAWLSEGLATYVEGVERVQAGNRAETDVWAEDARSMPRGLPQAGDEGLDHTHSWGRTYWGGALFCLLADLDIRRRTNERFGLQDALRAIAHQSGGLTAEWPVARIFAVGDAAVGVPALTELYNRMKDRPVETDLPALWRSLGIEVEGDSVRLRDDAPLARERKAIMAAPRRSSPP
jgi:hypothetical protein